MQNVLLRLHPCESVSVPVTNDGVVIMKFPPYTPCCHQRFGRSGQSAEGAFDAEDLCASGFGDEDWFTEALHLVLTSRKLISADVLQQLSILASSEQPSLER